MRIEVNGIGLYYERAGSGPPVILLHGNGESSAAFAQLASRLGDAYTVFAIDSRNHGRSDRSDKADYEDMADDVAAFIAALSIERPILFGFSDGGIVGLLTAAGHPGLLSKLIAAGANTRPDGLAAWFRLLLRGAYLIKRNKLTKLMLEQPDISDEALGKIDIPVLIMAGGRDVIREAHTREIAAAIPGAKLVLLPGETHGSYMKKTDKLLAVMSEAGFLPGAGSSQSL